MTDPTDTPKFPNATDSSYTLVAADVGKTIKVKVTFTDDAGFEETLTSTATEEASFAVQQQRANSAATGAPVISGTAQVGETLTADTSGIADADGLSGATFSYQWISNDGNSDTDITGATGSTYTLIHSDEGNTIKVKVSFTDDASNEETLTSAATGRVEMMPYETPKNESNPVEHDFITLLMLVGYSPTDWDVGIAINYLTPDADPSTTDYIINFRLVDSGGNFRTNCEGKGFGGSVHLTTVPDDGEYQHDAVQTCGGSARIEFLDGDGNFIQRYDQSPINAPATGAPIITGTAQVGETLTADVSGIADPDGITHALFSYQWISNDGTSNMDIAGATGSTYTLVAADQGKTIKVKVTFFDDIFNEETLTSSATTTVGNSPATGVPTITGTAQVGETLTADVSGIADADGLTSVAYSYQWISNDGTSDTHIAGATSSTYTLMSTDVGKTIKVEVNFTDDAGFNETLTSTATDEVSFAVGKQGVENSPATGAPTITGTPQVGETLTADTSGIDDADGLRGATFSYQWISNGSSGMMTTATTNPTYTLGAFDNDHTIKVKVSFTDDAGNDEALTSAATSSVAARPNSEATGAPTISGTAQVGETLTADTSGIADSDGLSSVSYSYQWISNDGNSDSDIAGATNSTYTLVATDEGNTIKVKVSFTDDEGYSESLTSTETASVISASEGASGQGSSQNSPATGAPTINGTAQVGETLTADTSGIADADGLANVFYSYQWVSNDGTSDTEIPNATDSTYTLVVSDEGNTIKVEVSFTDDAGFEETLTSEATAAVTAAEPDEPPARPQGLTGTVAHDAVSLTWDDPGDATITGYQILRRDRALHDSGDFQLHVNDTGSAAAAYIDRDVSPEGSYVYRIKARNAAGLSGQSSYFRADTPSAPAQNSPATGEPTIGGTARVGETLTADVSGIADADGLSGATFSYQWISNDGNADTDIVGATGSTYTLTTSDEGKAIKVRVSFTDDGGYGETLSSAATAAIAAQNSPAIEGVVRVGETLTVDTSGIANLDGLRGVTFSYQWISNDGTTDMDITGATDSTYTLTANDEGKIIKVRVTFTLTSAATDEVEAGS